MAAEAPIKVSAAPLSKGPLTTRADRATPRRNPGIDQWPAPTEAEMASPEFYAVKEAIKFWDIAISTADGYAGANGSHVVVIMKALEWTKDPELCAAFRLGGIEAVRRLQERDDG